MASLKYNTLPGPPQKLGDQYYYSQTVDLGDGIVKCSGQGGWDPVTGEVATNAREQVELTIRNTDKVLKAAGLRGWDDVYLIRSFHVDIDETLLMVDDVLRKRITGHRPAWTAVGVTRLALSTMEIEIEVEPKRSGT